MYSDYFGLTEGPFSITPDPRYLFMSRRHREALAHLLFGIGEGGGFVQLTGDIGMGKTTLCRCLLEQLPDNVDVALILNPRLTALELVASICDELHVDYPRGTDSLKVLVDALNHALLDTHARGRRTVLIIDEAQNLSTEVLEQVRLLTNLETTREKLLQIILIGQPELIDVLDRPDLRQLAQRITARYHLTALDAAETRAYIQHRLSIAGARGELFGRAAIQRVHQLSGGIPRLINIICDRALLGAYAQNKTQVSPRIVSRAASEVQSHGRPGWTLRRRFAIAAGAATLTLAGVLAWYWQTGYQESLQAAVHAPGVTTASPDDAAPPAADIDTAGVAGASDAPDQRDTTAATADAAKPPPAADRAAADVLAEAHLSALFASDPDAGLKALFRHWQQDYAGLPGISACERAAAAKLGCLARSGTWNNLRQLGVPVAIRLVDADGKAAWLDVARIDADSVSTLGDEQTPLPRAQLDRYWYGEYFLLWQRPPLGSAVLQLGVYGVDVEWLRSRLDALQGPAPVTGDPARFDLELRARVMAFQRQHGLHEDGIVGDHTLMQLVLAAPSATPRDAAPLAAGTHAEP